MLPDEEVKQRLGRRIVRLREARGWSQGRLAAEAKMHVTYLSNVERGKRNVSLETIVKLAAALDVPIATLFEGDETGI